MSYLVGQSDVFRILIERALDKKEAAGKKEKGGGSSGGGGSSLGASASVATPGSPKRQRKGNAVDDSDLLGAWRRPSWGVGVAATSPSPS